MKVETRVRLSRTLNWCLGGNKSFMLSTQAYINDRKVVMRLIDSLFWLIRREKNHCRNCYNYDIQDLHRDIDGLLASYAGDAIADSRDAEFEDMLKQLRSKEDEI